MSQVVDRPLRLSTAFWILGVYESVSEFVSNSNSDFLIFFLGGLCGYIRRDTVPIK